VTYCIIIRQYHSVFICGQRNGYQKYIQKKYWFTCVSFATATFGGVYKHINNLINISPYER
jgi:hypothetical protein